MVARRVVAALLVIAASILAPLSIGALWAERTVMRTDRFVATVEPLAHSDEVNRVVGDAVADAIIERVDAGTRLGESLPDRELLTRAIASGVNSAIEAGVTRFIDGDVFDDVWIAISTQVQQQLSSILRGEGPESLSLSAGQLTLDTGVVLANAQAALVERGIPLVGLLDLSDAGEQIVLVDSPQLQQAADVLGVFLPVAPWLWVGVLALFVAGVLLWPRRSRGLAYAGVGLAVGGVVLWAGLDLGQASLVRSAPAPERGELTDVLATVLLRFLANGALVMVAVGVALAVAAWLGGAARTGTRVRLAVTDAAHRWGNPLATTPLGHAAARVPLLVPALRAAVIALAAVLLLAEDVVTPSRVGWICLALAAGLLAVEVVEGAGRRRDELLSGAVVAD